MNGSRELTAKELLSYLEYQQDFVLKELPVSNKETPIEISSRYYIQFERCLWYANALEKLKKIVEGNTVTYSIPSEYDTFNYCYLRFSTPQITVKKEDHKKYKIRMIKNFGHNIVKSATFEASEKNIQKIDSGVFDIKSQWYMDPGAGYRENYNYFIGNLEKLQNYSGEIPSHTFNVEQSWYFSEDPSLAYPIFFHDKEPTRGDVKFSYSFLSKITDIIIMAEFDAEDKFVKYINDSKEISSHLEEHSPVLKIPEMWANMSLLTNGEKNHYKNSISKDESGSGFIRKYFVKDFVTLKSSNPLQIGKIETLNLSSIFHPALAFFWSAKNVTQLKTSYSNYTNNSENSREGSDPIKWTTLKYNLESKFNEMPSDHFTWAQARKHFPSCPVEVGYHGNSIAWNSSSLFGERAISPNAAGMSLICKIDDFVSPEYNDEKGGENEIQESYAEGLSKSKNKDSFILEVKVMIVKKMVFKQKVQKEGFDLEIY